VLSFNIDTFIKTNSPLVNRLINDASMDA